MYRNYSVNFVRAISTKSSYNTQVITAPSFFKSGSGILKSWNKSKNDYVKKNDTLAIIADGNDNVQVKTHHNGTITDQLIEPNEKVWPKQPMYIIDTASKANIS